MRKHLYQNVLSFIITDATFALVCYNFFIASNSTVSGSVDKVQGAIQVTGIVLLVLSGSFIAELE
jgi:hypothetical protein